MAGTPEFLTDTRRGLYSYEALESRLSENTFASAGLRDFSGPVIRLPNLTPEELFVVLTKLRHIHASGDSVASALPDDALRAFMDHCSRRIGEAYFRTPRDTIRAFVQMLAILEQNPEAEWSDLVGKVQIEPEANPDIVGLEEVGPAEPSGDELASFRL